MLTQFRHEFSLPVFPSSLYQRHIPAELLSKSAFRFQSTFQSSSPFLFPHNGHIGGSCSKPDNFLSGVSPPGLYQYASPAADTLHHTLNSRIHHSSHLAAMSANRPLDDVPSWLSDYRIRMANMLPEVFFEKQLLSKARPVSIMDTPLAPEIHFHAKQGLITEKGPNSNYYGSSIKSGTPVNATGCDAKTRQHIIGTSSDFKQNSAKILYNSETRHLDYSQRCCGQKPLYCQRLNGDAGKGTHTFSSPDKNPDRTANGFPDKIVSSASNTSPLSEIMSSAGPFAPINSDAPRPVPGIARKLIFSPQKPSAVAAPEKVNAGGHQKRKVKVGIRRRDKVCRQKMSSVGGGQSRKAHKIRAKTQENNGANSELRKTFKCSHCRYRTDRKNNLKRHIVTMHQRSPRVLECCGTMFHSKASLRDHVTLFHRGGYRCQVCERNFCRKALLRRHLTVHSGQKDFCCRLCGYATSHKSNLERHQRVHFRKTSLRPPRSCLPLQPEQDSEPQIFSTTSQSGSTMPSDLESSETAKDTDNKPSYNKNLCSDSLDLMKKIGSTSSDSSAEWNKCKEMCHPSEHCKCLQIFVTGREAVEISCKASTMSLSCNASTSSCNDGIRDSKCPTQSSKLCFPNRLKETYPVARVVKPPAQETTESLGNGKPLHVQGTKGRLKNPLRNKRFPLNRLLTSQMSTATFYGHQQPEHIHSREMQSKLRMCCRPYRCFGCGATFARQAELRGHICVVTAGNVYDFPLISSVMKGCIKLPIPN